MNAFHTPVLVAEVIDLLRIKPGDTVIDATVGFAGHMREFIRCGAWVLGIDADQTALTHAEKSLKAMNLTGYRLVRGNFRDIADIAKVNGVTRADAILFDLGVSSYQLDTGERGFTYRQHDAPLDMRFDPTSGRSAEELINTLPSEKLYEIILRYGEEKHSRAISVAIDRARSVGPIRTAGNLKAAIEDELGAHVAEQALPRVFQAFRIAVNDEMGSLNQALTQAEGLVKPGGRLGVISFHSLEDRVVKLRFRKPPWQQVNKKPVIAGQEELLKNRRSRSAKLRVAQRR
jgi:16S rRNA (cytosine1402-N4)-methyltransferase